MNPVGHPRERAVPVMRHPIATADRLENQRDARQDFQKQIEAAPGVSPLATPAIEPIVALRAALYHARKRHSPSERIMPNPVPEPNCITFDCYGTLVQWHAALRRAVRAVLAGRHGGSDWVESQIAEQVDLLRALSMTRQQQQPYCDYKTVLRSSLDEIMIRQGLSPRPEDGETLLSFLREIPPHPEVPATLQRLREHFRLAIISNSDDDLIAGTVAAIGVPIDFVVTAEQARAYKPDHRLFAHAHAVIGVAAEQTIHVGMGQVTDLKVCHEMGIRAVWIDRLGETLNPDWAPEATLPDLTALPDLLASHV